MNKRTIKPREHTEGIAIQSKGKTFIIKQGIRKRKIWISREDGEGGDFNQDAFYQTIRIFYDKRF